MEQINARLLSWASILEDSTREQALRTARCRSSTRTWP